MMRWGEKCTKWNKSLIKPTCFLLLCAKLRSNWVFFSPSLLPLGCHVCWGCSSPTEHDPAATPDPPSPRQHTDSQLLYFTLVQIHKFIIHWIGETPTPNNTTMTPAVLTWAGDTANSGCKCICMHIYHICMNRQLLLFRWQKTWIQLTKSVTSNFTWTLAAIKFDFTCFSNAV